MRSHKLEKKSSKRKRKFGLEIEAAPSDRKALKQMLRASGFAQVDVKHTPSMRWLKKIKAAITTRPESGRLIVHAS